MIEEKNSELLVICRKANSAMSIPICKLFINNMNMLHRLITRDIIVDTLGPYTMLYSKDVDIENVITQLRIECLGEEVQKKMHRQNNEQVSTEVSTKKSIDIQTLFDQLERENPTEPAVVV